MGAVASFHLTSYPGRRAVVEMARTLGARRELAATPGLRFARVLGTGKGAAMGLGGDLRRWATVIAWHDESALDRFLADAPLARHWADHGEETYTVRLAPISAHGSWAGQQPFEAVATDQDRSGPVAVLTRATIPFRHWPAFYRAVPPVERWMHQQAGLHAVVGIGEVPVGRQATFSLWESTAALERFAYHGSAHHHVVHRTGEEGWFSEELFARFRPYGSTGTWSGRNPLGGNGS